MTFDVYFDKGLKTNAAIYVINTGRKQLVLTPKHHQAILEDLIRRNLRSSWRISETRS